MKLTKDIDATKGLVRFIIAKAHKSGGEVRWFVETATKFLDKNSDNYRDVVAADLWQARRELRRLAELPPPA